MSSTPEITNYEPVGRLHVVGAQGLAVDLLHQATLNESLTEITESKLVGIILTASNNDGNHDFQLTRDDAEILRDLLADALAMTGEKA